MSDKINQIQMERQFVEWSRRVDADREDVAFIREIGLSLADEGELRILDVGGGTGDFLAKLSVGLPVSLAEVVDPSEIAEQARVVTEQVRHIKCDFMDLETEQQYELIIFRTVLHHMVGRNLEETDNRQSAALGKAKEILAKNGRIVIVENFYEPFIGSDLTGAVIFQITRIKWAAWLTRKLGANTAGVGVRFRSKGAWLRMLDRHNLSVDDECKRADWGEKKLPLYQTLGLLCKSRFQGVLSVRRDNSDRSLLFPS